MAIDPRQKTWDLAQVNVDEAYKFAAEISDDWFRCQALATTAWHTPSKPRFLKIANEALKSAKKLTNPNSRVSCSAWVIRTMAEREDIDISMEVQECLIDIRKEENPVRRADALFLLFEAVFSDFKIREEVFEALWNSIVEMKSWKRERLLGDLALVVAGEDLNRAVNITHSITKASIERKTLEQIEKGEWLGPHEFFPHYAKSTEAHPVR